MTDKTRYRMLLAIVAAIAVAPVAACKRPIVPSTAVVALVDLSGSIPEETTQFYASTLTTLVWDKLSAKDSLVVLPIDSEAEAKSEPLFSENLAATNFSDTKDGFAHREERERARVAAFIKTKAPSLNDAVLSAASRRKANRNGTDIVGAINAATAHFPSTTGRRVLLIFSDMVQESRELNVKQLSKAGDGRAIAIVKELVDRGRIPQLRDVTVVVVGAGETSAGSDSSAFFRSLRTFWKDFFKAAGATLDDRYYGYRPQDRIPEVLAAKQ